MIDHVKAAVRPADFWPRVVERFKPAGREWADALCPFHADGNPSLRVNLQTGGWRCMSCGEKGGDIISFRAKLDGVSQSEAAYRVAAHFGLVNAPTMKPKHDGDRPRPVPRPSGNGKVYATPEAFAATLPGTLAGVWHYADRDGNPALAVVRVDGPDGKTYRPVRPVAGGWTPGDPPGPLPLYNLPAVLAGSGQRVFVTEGEKGVEAARTLGLLATTSPHGAKAAEKADWTPLRGREVVILPDADEAGRGYARDVSKLLLALDPPGRVRIVDLRKLWPDLPEGGDLADYVAFRDSVDADDLRIGLEELAAKTPEVDTKRAGPVLVRMADVRAEPVHWLWPNRIPLGKTCLIVGDPNVGKSYLTLDLAARVSAGRPWPDAPTIPNPAGAVVLLSAEDDLADTIRPRLDRLGADVTRITAIRAVRLADNDAEAAFCLERDLAALEQAIGDTKARLAVVDPLTAFLGAVDSHKNAEIRGLLAPLAEVAARHRVAVVGVNHLNKSGTSNRALYRAMGSLAFVAAARAVWLAARDPADPDRRLLLPVKLNIAPDPTGLAFRIDGDGLTWDPGEVAMTADDLLAAQAGAGGEDAGERGEARDFLREALAAGPVAVRDLQKSAKGAGLAWRTVRRAQADLGVTVRKVGFLNETRWEWRLPTPVSSELREGGQSLIHRELATFGEVGHLRAGGPENAVFGGAETASGIGYIPEGGQPEGDKGVGHLRPAGDPGEVCEWTG